MPMNPGVRTPVPTGPRTNILRGAGSLPRQPGQPTRGTQPAYPPTKLPGYGRQPTPVRRPTNPGLTPEMLQRLAARRLGG